MDEGEVGIVAGEGGGSGLSLTFHYLLDLFSLPYV